MLVPNERAASPPQPIAREKLLLVEGCTPAHFFEGLALHLDLSATIEIRDFGGVNQLRLFLRTIAATADFRQKVKSLGIIRDAEENPAGAMQSINDAVRDARLSSSVSVHVAVLPDNSTAGMVETLFLRSVANDPLMTCVSTFFECARANGASLPAEPKMDKNRSQVFLATKLEAQQPPGQAARRGSWPFDHQAFDGVKDFLRNL